VWSFEVGAHLERDPAVAVVGGQAPEGDAPSARRYVIDDPDSVAQGLGAAPLQPSQIERQAEGLPGWIVKWKFSRAM